MADFDRKTEQYAFNASFVMHPESLLMGTEASILVRPSLTVNGMSYNLGLMKNVKAKVSTTSFIDDIPITKSFDRLELSSAAELELAFPVPANLDRVEVELTGEVMNVTKGETEKFSGHQSWHLRTHKESHQFYDYFLRKLDGQFVFMMLGKNGEPVEA